MLRAEDDWYFRLLSIHARMRQLVELFLTGLHPWSRNSIFTEKPHQENINKVIALYNFILLHIMCGYQCDKAMTKNGTREVI